MTLGKLQALHERITDKTLRSIVEAMARVDSDITASLYDPEAPDTDDRPPNGEDYNELWDAIVAEITAAAPAPGTVAQAVCIAAGYTVDGDGVVYDWIGPGGQWSGTIGFESAQAAWEAAYKHYRGVDPGSARPSAPETAYREIFGETVLERATRESRERTQNMALDRLTDEYHAWMKSNGLDLGSADEHLFDENLTAHQREWLKDFYDRWQKEVG